MEIDEHLKYTLYENLLQVSLVDALTLIACNLILALELESRWCQGVSFKFHNLRHVSSC